MAALSAVRSGVRLKLTRVGLGSLVVAVIILAAGFNTANNLLYLLAAVLFCLHPVSAMLAAAQLGRIQAELHLPYEVRAGRPASAAIRLTSGRRRGGSAGLVTRIEGSVRAAGSVSWLGAGEKTTIGVELPARRRGVLPVQAWLGSLFPLSLLEAVRVGARAELLVLPRSEKEWFDEQELASSDDGDASRLIGPGQDLLDIRDYRDGDDARAMDWRATARLARPMVRENARDEERRLTLVLDPGLPEESAHPEEAVEQAISRLAGAAEELEERGWRLRLMTPGGAFAGSSREILRRLARVEVGGRQGENDWWTESCPTDEPVLVFRAREDGHAS